MPAEDGRAPANNLKSSSDDVDYVEVSEAGRKRVKEATGYDCVPLEKGWPAPRRWCWRCPTPR